MDIGMIQSTIEMIKLQAEENMVLTNGEAYSSIGGMVYLGKNDSSSNWYEITAEEYKAIQEEKERKSLEGIDE